MGTRSSGMRCVGYGYGAIPIARVPRIQRPLIALDVEGGTVTNKTIFRRPIGNGITALVGALLLLHLPSHRRPNSARNTSQIKFNCRFAIASKGEKCRLNALSKTSPAL